MSNIQTRLQHIRWLQSIGIEYYCSDKEKDSKNLLIDKIQQKNKQTSQEIQPIKPTPKVKQEPIMSPKKKKTTKDKIEDQAAVDRARELANKAQTIDELYEMVKSFDGCSLKEFASNTVFGQGPQDSPVVIVGEAPGAKEDEQGVPFCGESGILLDAMLKTIGISRQENAYITNTIFWRPPANRRPTVTEIEICRPFVEKHIALKKPKLIILVGSTAAASLIGKDESISEIRQNNYSYTNPYITEPVCTTALFHPAYLLRQPMQRKNTWYDLLKIKDLLTKLDI
ncbi:MAG: hypothetical protein DGJ47_000683 [Rickettsiaceae bacterium]